MSERAKIWTLILPKLFFLIMIYFGYLQNNEGFMNATAFMVYFAFVMNTLLQLAQDKNNPEHADALRIISTTNTKNTAGYSIIFYFFCACLVAGSGHFLTATVLMISAMIHCSTVTTELDKNEKKAKREQRAASVGGGYTGSSLSGLGLKSPLD